MRRVLSVATWAIALSACNGTNAPPSTPGEFYAGNSYVPLDPLPVKIEDGPHCGAGHPHQDLYKDLPDNTVRVAVQQLDVSGNLAFGPAQVGGANHIYRVILDYVNTNEASIPIAFPPTRPGFLPTGFRRLKQGELPAAGEQMVVVPVYVGVGVRLTADVKILKGTVNLSGLGSLMAAAEAQQVTGTLVAQTLGVTGPKVIAALPLPNKLDVPTIENSIIAMGAIKALIWSGSDTWQTPRVTGVYLPLKDANQTTISMIVSQLADSDTLFAWHLDCP